MEVKDLTLEDALKLLEVYRLSCLQASVVIGGCTDGLPGIVPAVTIELARLEKLGNMECFYHGQINFK